MASVSFPRRSWKEAVARWFSMRRWSVPIGLLTPIGRMHLDAAKAEGMTTVVFGTNAWQVLPRFAEIAGVGAPVLFYVSYDLAAREASWQAMFVEYREGPGGFPPRDWKRYREPIAAEEDTGPGPGFSLGTIWSRDSLLFLIRSR